MLCHGWVNCAIKLMAGGERANEQERDIRETIALTTTIIIFAVVVFVVVLFIWCKTLIQKSVSPGNCS